MQDNPIRPERRQVTILFSDIVGSSGLSQRLDPEDLRDLLRLYQKTCTTEIERFDGTVSRYVGDGIIALFGYPRAHEEDPERAISAGLAIVAQIASLDVNRDTSMNIRLAVRVGIATGLVVAGDSIGEGVSEEAAVVGETPNLAARLQQVAEPNTVIIQDITKTLAGTRFEYAELGALNLSGFSQPVRAWKVLGRRLVRSRFEAAHPANLTPLVGRETNLLALLERWKLATQEQGQVVLLSGEAGIGKSRIAQALDEHLETREHELVRFQCSSYHLESALYPFIEQLEWAAKLATSDAPSEKLDKLERLVEASGLQVAVAVPLLASLLSIPDEGRYPLEAMISQQQKERTLGILVDHLRGLSTRNPLLVIFEDVHWADPTSLELIQRIITAVRSERILLIITYRPDFKPPWKHGNYISEMVLERLTSENAEGLAAGVVKDDVLPLSVIREIVSKTDGVPLFIEEVTKAVHASRSMEDSSGSGALLTVPATIRDTLSARLDHMGAAKQFAQIGATIGRSFSYTILAAAAETPIDILNDAISRLVDSGLLYQEGQPPQAMYSFKHALIQDAAYESLLKSTRRQYHQRIAELLEKDFPEIAMTAPELLARHFTSCGFDQKAIGYWEKAGKRALERAANREAIVHLQKALEVLKNLADKSASQKIELNFQLSLMAANMAIEGWASQKVEACCLRARDLSFELGDNQSIFGASWGLWTVHFLRGELGAALEVANQVLNMALGANVKMVQVMAHHAVGFTKYFRGELIEAREHAAAGIGLFELKTERQIVNAFQFSSTMALRFFLSTSLWFLGKIEESQIELEHASHLIADLNHAPSSAAFMAFKLSSYLYLGDTKEIRDTAEKLKALCEENGFRLYISVAKMYLGWALAEEGEIKAGFEQMKGGLKEYRRTRSRIKLVEVYTMLAEIHRKAGFPKKALSAIKKGIDDAERRQEHLFEPELYRLRGEIRLEQGNDIAAAADFDRALDIARGQGALSLALRAVMSRCRLLRKLGRLDEARQELSKVYSCFTEGFNTKDLVDAQSLRNELRAS